MERSKYSEIRQTHEQTLENNRRVHREAREAFDKFSQTAQTELQEEHVKCNKIRQELENFRNREREHEMKMETLSSSHVSERDMYQREIENWRLRQNEYESVLSEEREKSREALEMAQDEWNHETNSKIERVRDEYSEVKENLLSWDKKHESVLSEERETYRKEFQTAREKWEQETRGREMIQEEYSELKETLLRKQKECSQIEDTTRSLNEQNSKLKKKLKAGWNQFEKLKESYEILQSEKSEKKEDTGDETLNEKLKERIREQLESEKMLRSTLAEAQDELAKIEQTFEVEKNKLLVSSQEQLSENKHLMQLLENARSEAKTKLEQLEEEKSALVLELRFVTKKLESEQNKGTEVDKLRQRLRLLDQEREEHLQDLKKTDLSIIREVKAEKESELVTLRESLNKERQRVEQFKQKLRDVVSMCSKYKEANVALKQSCSDAQRQVEIGKAQIIKLSQLMSMRN